MLVTLGFLTQVCLLLGVRVLSLLWSSRKAQDRLFCGDLLHPPTHCHVSTRGLTPPHWDGLLLGLVGTWGQQEDSGSCKALGVSFAGKMDWLLGDRGAWASPCGLSRKGKCGQAGNRCSEVGGRPVGEDRLSSAVPEPQHSGHCCPLSRSHIDPLVTQVSI